MLINYTLASSPWKHPGRVGTAVAMGTQFRCFNHKVVTLVTGLAEKRDQERKLHAWPVSFYIGTTA